MMMTLQYRELISLRGRPVTTRRPITRLKLKSYANGAGRGMNCKNAARRYYRPGKYHSKFRQTLSDSKLPVQSPSISVLMAVKLGYVVDFLSRRT